MKPTLFKTKIVKKEMLNAKTLLLTLQHIEPIEMDFKPGQFVNIKVDENTFRSYSICGNFEEKNKLELIISVGHEGVGSNFVKSKQIGDTIELIGPSGRYSLKMPLPENIYFFATGTGIAPFISFLYYLKANAYKGNIKLFFGVRDESEIFFEDVLNDFKRTLNHFTYELWLSKVNGRVSIPAKNNEFEKDAHFYLCGHPDMVSEISDLLKERGVKEENILFEKFTRSIV